MTLHTLIFDIDGTVAETEKDGHLPAFNQAFADFGVDWRWDSPLYHRLLAVTGGKERIKHYLKQHHPDFYRADLDDWVAAIHRTKTEHFTRYVQTGQIAPRPGVKRLLEEAQQAGLRLAIATTTSQANVEALLTNTLKMPGHDFAIIACGEVVKHKKPAADVYHYVLDQLNIDAQDCLAFEDSLNGIQSAKAAGIHTVITISEYTKDQQFTDALIVLDHLGEPTQPFSVLDGDSLGYEYVNVPFLLESYAKYCR